MRFVAKILQDIPHLAVAISDRHVHVIAERHVLEC